VGIAARETEDGEHANLVIRGIDKREREREREI
jgi:hypothetical protein